jgi:hypothetical protein
MSYAVTEPPGTLPIGKFLNPGPVWLGIAAIIDRVPDRVKLRLRELG